MNPSRPFILRPVATSLLMVAVLLVGIVSFKFLPLSALPEVDYPTIQIQTFYPDASPDVMNSSVTAPLERQLGEMPGLKQMSSASSAGASVITLQFDLVLSLDIAEQEVQAEINAAGNLLPSDLPAPPIYAKVNPADAPVLTLAITSKTLPLTQVEDMVDSRLAAKISQLPGVGLVSISGGQRPAVHVQANPQALAAYGLNIDDLRTTVSNANVNTPKGNFDGPTRDYTINANDQIQQPTDYMKLVIAYKNGAPVHLSDVASVENGAENGKLQAWVNTTPAIILNIQRQPGANVIKVVDSIQAMLPTLKATLPEAVDVAVLTDRTNTIRASVSDTEFELALAVALVILVIYLFLQNVPSKSFQFGSRLSACVFFGLYAAVMVLLYFIHFMDLEQIAALTAFLIILGLLLKKASATIIPSLSIPLSLVGTLGIMYLSGFSLNNLTLMALIIATGFVVDDAIVMIENISRYIEQGEKPLQAALKGSGQIGFTIISLTVSLIAVLIPLLFMGDVVGRLFREFAITLAVTIVISAFVSLTLVPMLCALMLEQHEDQVLKREPDKKDKPRWFDRMINKYGEYLNWVLDHSALTLIVFFVTLGLTILLYVVIPKGFFPVQDTGLIQGISEATQGTSFSAMGDRQTELAAAVLKDPNVENLSSFIGVDGTNTTLNAGRFLISLKDRDSRSETASDIIRDLQRETAKVPGITLYMQPVQDLTIDATISRTQYQFILEDASLAELNQWTPKLVQAMQKLPKVADVASNIQGGGLSAYVDIDRDTAGRFGITPATVDNALYDSFGQRIVSTIFTQSNQYRVILEADPDLQNSLSSLGNLYLPASGGGQVPLSAIAKVSTQTVPLEIDHLGQFPAATVSFNLAPGAALGDAVNSIQQTEKEIGMPDSVITTFQGATLAFQQSLGNELLLIIAAIITMYIVLGVLYESFIHPITILSTLPSAGVGALLALMISGSDLGIIGIIGIVLLIGIVKKNAIMMIDFALDAERNQGKSPRDAIHQACLLRFRPILMTTMSALLAAVPLMLGSGTGSELRHPLGVAIAGGLIFSQLLTLFTTPVIYLALDRYAKRIDPAHDLSDEEDMQTDIEHEIHDSYDPSGQPA